tara:strand:+ start:70 stop:1017 length:948 start_codon:yes stop_codon:yes gene_type:complete
MPAIKSPESITQDGQGLVQGINSLITQAVKAEFDGQPKDHPLIVVNAVKNIIGDDRGNPSQNLLKLSKNYINQFSGRNDDDRILNNVIKTGFGLTVFVDEVEEALMSGNKEAAELETAKQLLASDKSPAMLELLAELAMHNITSLGLFTYHWLRSYQFLQDKEMLWAYARSMINEIFKGQLQQHTPVISQKPQDHLNAVISDKLHGLWPTFSAMDRLWDCDYIRIESYRKSISSWLEKQTFNKVEVAETDSTGLTNYINHSGRYFIDLAEDIIDNHKGDVAVIKIIELESLRGIAKTSTPESFPRISQCINFTAS